ncbi:MAG: hypothetical protein M0Z61_17850 [Nitrospiraceae bacterium]|nr:hypothetical protein [Nitrospiraceae bacterium]
MKSGDSRSSKPAGKRSESRKMITEQVSLIPLDNTGKKEVSKKEGESMQCVTLNTSGSGVSVYIEKSLQSGSRFIIYSGKLWDVPKEGIVKWCTKIASGLYRAGICLEKKWPGRKALSCAEESEKFEGPEKKS